MDTMTYSEIEELSKTQTAYLIPTLNGPLKAELSDGTEVVILPDNPASRKLLLWAMKRGYGNGEGLP